MAHSSSMQRLNRFIDAVEAEPKYISFARFLRRHAQNRDEGLETLSELMLGWADSVAQGTSIGRACT